MSGQVEYRGDGNDPDSGGEGWIYFAIIVVVLLLLAAGVPLL